MMDEAQRWETKLDEKANVHNKEVGEELLQTAQAVVPVTGSKKRKSGKQMPLAFRALG